MCDFPIGNILNFLVFGIAVTGVSTFSEPVRQSLISLANMRRLIISSALEEREVVSSSPVDHSIVMLRDDNLINFVRLLFLFLSLFSSTFLVSLLVLVSDPNLNLCEAPSHTTWDHYLFPLWLWVALFFVIPKLTTRLAGLVSSMLFLVAISLISFLAFEFFAETMHSAIFDFLKHKYLMVWLCAFVFGPYFVSVLLLVGGRLILGAQSEQLAQRERENRQALDPMEGANVLRADAARGGGSSDSS